jgi:hypothetical protein
MRERKKNTADLRGGNISSLASANASILVWFTNEVLILNTISFIELVSLREREEL